MVSSNMGLWSDQTLLAMFADCVAVTRSDERDLDVRQDAMETASRITTEYEIRTGVKLTSQDVV